MLKIIPKFESGQLLPATVSVFFLNDRCQFLHSLYTKNKINNVWRGNMYLCVLLFYIFMVTVQRDCFSVQLWLLTGPSSIPTYVSLWGTSGMMLTDESQRTGRKPCPSVCCPPHNPHVLPWE
jgi:hypothetical protein